jgi:hypothetical protein
MSVSVYGRTDVDHKRTDKVADPELNNGAALVHARGGRGSWGK